MKCSWAMQQVRVVLATASVVELNNNISASLRLSPASPSRRTAPAAHPSRGPTAVSSDKGSGTVSMGASPACRTKPRRLLWCICRQ